MEREKVVEDYAMTYLLLAIIATGDFETLGAVVGEGVRRRVGVGKSEIEGERVGDREGFADLVTVGEDVGADVGLTDGAEVGANVGVSACKIKVKYDLEKRVLMKESWTGS